MVRRFSISCEIEATGLSQGKAYAVRDFLGEFYNFDAGLGLSFVFGIGWDGENLGAGTVSVGIKGIQYE